MPKKTTPRATARVVGAPPASPRSGKSPRIAPRKGFSAFRRVIGHWSLARIRASLRSLNTGHRSPVTISFRFSNGTRTTVALSSPETLRGFSAKTLLSALGVLAVCLLPTAASAETDPANIPAGVESWLQCFFWLVGGVTALVVLFKQLFPKRHPPIEAEFVTKNDLEKFCTGRHQPIESILQSIQRDLREAETKRETYEKFHTQRSDEIHGRISRLVPVIYTIAGRLQIKVPEEGP